MSREKILQLLLGVIIFIIVQSCSKKQQTYEVSIFVDITDSAFKDPKLYTDLHNLMDYIKTDSFGDTTSRNGCNLRLLVFNDISENRSRCFNLAEGSEGMMGDNPLVRAQSISKFQKAVKDSFLDFLNATTFNKDSSKIHQNLCREFNQLGTKRVKHLIIIYSDMLENSSLFSFYRDSEKIDNFINNIVDADKFLSNVDCSFPDLKGIEIHIIAYRTPTNDPFVNKAQKFWTKFLQLKGATVFFDTELVLQQ
jgi:hypothetical protein